VNGFDFTGKVTQKELDWWANFFLSIGTGLMTSGVAEFALGVAMFYASFPGSPARFLDIPGKISLVAGALSVVAGAVFCKLSWYLNGMTPEEFDEAGPVLGGLVDSVPKFGAREAQDALRGFHRLIGG
jgi:hypothetical protein